MDELPTEFTYEYEQEIVRMRRRNALWKTAAIAWAVIVLAGLAFFFIASNRPVIESIRAPYSSIGIGLAAIPLGIKMFFWWIDGYIDDAPEPIAFEQIDISQPQPDPALNVADELFGSECDAHEFYSRMKEVGRRAIRPAANRH